MPDREKIIKGLNYCTHTDGAECPNCPYWKDDDCVEALHTDFLALLKEQKPIESIPRPITESFLTNYQAKILKDTFKDFTVVVRCKDCIYYHGKNEACGAINFYPPSGDWYCANGEKE